MSLLSTAYDAPVNLQTDDSDSAGVGLCRNAKQRVPFLLGTERCNTVDQCLPPSVKPPWELAYLDQGRKHALIAIRVLLKRWAAFLVFSACEQQPGKHPTWSLCFTSGCTHHFCVSCYELAMMECWKLLQGMFSHSTIAHAISSYMKCLSLKKRKKPFHMYSDSIFNSQWWSIKPHVIWLQS